MRLGVVIPQVGPWKALAEEFRWAEEIGYSTAYVYDHLTHPTAEGEWLADGFTVLGAAAVLTERIGLGTLVASATLHSPVALARLAATVDDVSDGRLVLALGAGSVRCAGADRDEQPTPREMFARLEDVVHGLGAVWAGETEWSGETRSFGGLQTLPLPRGRGKPSLVLAAHGPRAMALTARHADGWNTYGGPNSTELAAEDYWSLVADQCTRMDEACEAADRDPASLARSLLIGYGAVRPTANVAAYVEAVERAEALGFDEVMVYGPRTGGERFASDPDVHGEAVSSLT